MDAINETIYIEDNPTSGTWDIICDVGTFGESYQQAITTTIAISIYSDKYFTEHASGYSVSWEASSTNVQDIWGDGSLWCIRVPTNLTFASMEAGDTPFDSYLYLSVVVYAVTDTSRNNPLKTFGFTLRKLSSSPVFTPLEIAQAVWNYDVVEPESGTLGARTLSSDIAADVWNYGNVSATVLRDRTLSTTVEVNPSVIAQAVWNYDVAEPESGTLGTRTLTTDIPTAANIATAVLTADVTTESLGTADYTLKHLIMASQRAEVVTEDGVTTWNIMSNKVDPETGEEIVIASRTLTLNPQGAIVKIE